MDAKQFGWIYMFEQRAIGTKLSYYGGIEYDTRLWDEVPYWDTRKAARKWEEILEQITQVGVDWSKTREVESSTAIQFEGTFADSSCVAVLEGTLVLRDGRQFECQSRSDEIKHAFDMMARAAELAEKYADLV